MQAVLGCEFLYTPLQSPGIAILHSSLSGNPEPLFELPKGGPWQITQNLSLIATRALAGGDGRIEDYLVGAGEETTRAVQQQGGSPPLLSRQRLDGAVQALVQLGPPVERGENKGTRVFSVVYFSRGTLPEKG